MQLCYIKYPYGIDFKLFLKRMPVRDSEVLFYFLFYFRHPIVPIIKEARKSRLVKNRCVSTAFAFAKFTFLHTYYMSCKFVLTFHIFMCAYLHL